MKCWKCGQEVVGGTGVCPYCGATQARPEPTTETGRAMRALYDRYGAREVLTNSAYLVNGLADLTDVDKKLRNQLRMALDAGLGKVYLDQLSAGAPDSAFNNRVRIVLTEDAGLSDKAAETLAGYFDEMIGWRGAARPRPQQQAKPAEEKAQDGDTKNRTEQQNSRPGGSTNADPTGSTAPKTDESAHTEPTSQAPAKRSFFQRHKVLTVVMVILFVMMLSTTNEEITSENVVDTVEILTGNSYCTVGETVQIEVKSTTPKISLGYDSSIVSVEWEKSQKSDGYYYTNANITGVDTGNSTLRVYISDDKSIYDTIMFSVIASTEWTLEDGTLTISGNGPIDDYKSDFSPWRNQREDILQVVIEEGVTKIGCNAFINCSSITSVTIPSSVTEIGDSAFFDCASLTSVTIPASVTEIDDYAFQHCSSLTSVIIPSSVTEIGDSAFSQCDSLTDISVESGNPFYVSVNGVLFSADMTRLISYPSGKIETDFMIPSSVTEIGSQVFAECGNLTDISVEPGNYSYVSVDGVLFSADMTHLIAYPCGKNAADYSIPSGVTVIDSSAFHGCSITSVTIPSSVTEISGHAFDFCEGLTSVAIPSSVTEIGYFAFSGCDNLTGLLVDPGNPFFVSVDGVLFSTDMTRLVIYPGGKNATDYSIASSVTEIGYSAFTNCDRLTSVTIPGSVTKIGKYAFEFCPNLSDIYYDGTEAHWNMLTSNAAIPNTVIIHFGA